MSAPNSGLMHLIDTVTARQTGGSITIPATEYLEAGEKYHVNEPLDEIPEGLEPVCVVYELPGSNSETPKKTPGLEV